MQTLKSEESCPAGIGAGGQPAKVEAVETKDSTAPPLIWSARIVDEEEYYYRQENPKSNPRRPSKAELSKGQKNWWPVAFEDDRDPTTAELRSQLQADVAWSAWLEMQDANRVAHALFDLCKDKMGNRFPFRWRNLTNTGGILCCGTVEILAEQMIWELENLELFGASPDGHVERKATITVQVIECYGQHPQNQGRTGS